VETSWAEPHDDLLAGHIREMEIQEHEVGTARSRNRDAFFARLRGQERDQRPRSKQAADSNRLDGVSSM